jgi:hypothetical protein
MSRKSEFQTTSSNPTKKYLEWKSDDKCFAYYDKDKKENVKIELPFKFLTLMEFHTIKGWNDKNQSGVYSNEVKSIGNDELNVRLFKGNQSVKGIYKDIKEQIVSLGGHYTKSIYVMLEDGTIANINIKGSGVQSWGDFTQKTRSRLSDEWIQVANAIELKKGKVNYSIPEFKFATSLNDKESTLADHAYNELKSYIDGYLAKQIEVVDEEIVIDDNDISDLF